MTRFEKETFKERMLKLASMKSTGTPADLASRFGISPRSVKRIAKEVREEGYDLRYCKIGETYVID